MKPSRRDEITGTIHEVKGAVKESVGKLTNRLALQIQGKIEGAAGRAQKKFGQMKKAFGR